MTTSSSSFANIVAPSPLGSDFIALTHGVFAAALSLTFFLGGALGFALGVRRRPVEKRTVVVAPPQAKEESSEGRHRRRRRNDDDGDNEGDDDRRPTRKEEEDGPTIVLRGSLDLLASKWGIDAEDGTTRDDATKMGPEPSSLASSSSSSKVVEYLSPEKMTRLLFSDATRGRDGSHLDVSRTLRLDEERPCVGRKRRNDDIDDDGVTTTTIAPPPSPPIAPEAFVDLLRLVQRYSVDTSHPYFFNQLFGSLDPVALAAEIVALGVNTSAYTYETAPVFTLMEREVVDRVGRLVFHGGDGDDDDASENDRGKEEGKFRGDGLMMPGGSLANLTAMHAARHRWKVINGHDGNRRPMAPQCDSGTSTMEEEDRHHRRWSSDGSVGEEKKADDDASAASDGDGTTLHEEDDPSMTMPDLVAFVSSEAHYSFAKSARVLGLREDDLIVIPTHPDGRMDVAELAKSIEELERAEDCYLETQRDTGDASSNTTPQRRIRRRVPFFVACTAGSTVRGSFDDVAEIAEVCRAHESRGDHRDGARLRRSLWVHVDGAWGGSAIFSTRPSIRRAARVDDYRLADSFTFNPHKMLGAPQQTTAFVTRRRGALRDSNASGAGYLFDPRKNGAAYDLGDLSHACGRRTDAVKLWALWKYHGREGLGRRVDGKVDGIEAFAGEVRRRGREDGSFALACGPWPFNVNFFYFPPRIRRVLEARGVLKTAGFGEGAELENDDFVQIPEDMAQDLSNVSVTLKLRLHEAGEMIIPYQPLNNQKADCFRLVLAGKKDFSMKDVRYILDTMEKYGADL